MIKKLIERILKTELNNKDLILLYIGGFNTIAIIFLIWLELHYFIL